MNMKNKKFQIVIGVVAFSAVAFLIVAGSAAMMRGGGERREGSMENIYEHKFDIADIKEIEISYISEKIILYPSDSDELVVKEYLNTTGENMPAIIKNENGRLQVKSGKSQKSWWNIFQIPLGVEKIEVYLPMSYRNSLSLSTVSGSVTSDQSWEMNKVSANSTSGAIKIAGISAKQFSLSTVSGKIVAGKLTGSGNASTTSGSISLESKKVDGDIHASTVSGSVKITVPQKSDFGFKVSTVSGRINSFFELPSKGKKNVSARYGEKTDISIDLSTVSGSITIEAN